MDPRGRLAKVMFAKVLGTAVFNRMNVDAAEVKADAITFAHIDQYPLVLDSNIPMCLDSKSAVCGKYTLWKSQAAAIFDYKRIEISDYLNANVAMKAAQMNIDCSTDFATDILPIFPTIFHTNLGAQPWAVAIRSGTYRWSPAQIPLAGLACFVEGSSLGGSWLVLVDVKAVLEHGIALAGATSGHGFAQDYHVGRTDGWQHRLRASRHDRFAVVH